MDIKLIFDEISSHLMKDDKPSIYLNNILKDEKYNVDPINKIFKLQQIEQNPKYHPEGNVLNHVFMVVDKASQVKHKSEYPLAFMWAALLHDIGKLTTTKIRKGRITSYNHDNEGENISKEMLDKLTDDEELKYQISKLVRYHMQPLFFDKNLPFFTFEDMINDIDYKEVALLSSCDRLGRGQMTSLDKERELNNIKKFKKYCKDIERRNK